MFKVIKVDKTEKVSKDGLTIYSGIANTPALDRDNEVLLPRGVVTEDFMKNPVMLMIHNYRAVPVGKVIKLDVTEERVKFDFTFADTKLVQDELELPKLFEDGIMSAFSVGFYPKGWVDIDAEMKGEVTVELPNGDTQKVDLDKYERNPDRIYTKWDLLEISPVPVPSNPEALLLREFENIKTKAIELMPTAKSFIEETFEENKGKFLETLKSFNEGMGDFKLRGAVLAHATPINTEMSWDGGKARATIAKWASSDDSGDKEKMNWSKYSKGFAWFDEASADNFSAYKLPHHVIEDEKLVGVWRGVTSAMAELLGAGAGSDLPDEDKRMVYDHLAKHYKDNDTEPPEYKEYEEAELKAIEEGTYKTDTSAETGTGASAEAGKGIEDKTVTDLIKRVEESVEGISEVGIRLSIMSDVLEAIERAIKIPKGSGDTIDGDKVPDELKKALDGFVETKD